MPPPVNRDSISATNMTLRYIESLEARVDRLEKREKWFYAKMTALWMAFFGLIGKVVGAY